MKRILSVFLAICMLFTLVLPVFALETATLAITEDSSDGELKAGDTVVATATVPAVNNIASGLLKITFKKDILEVNAIEAPGSLGGYGTTVTSVATANQNGFVSISIGNGATHAFDMGEDLVLKITFVVKDNAAVGAVTDLIAVDTADGYYFEDEDSNEVTAPPFDVDTYSASIVSASSSSNATMSVSEDGGDGELKAGDTVVATATVPAVNNIASGLLKITFKKDILEVNAIEAPGSLGGYGTTVTSVATANQNGFVSISIGNGATHAFDMGEDLVLKITFVVKDNAAVGAVTDLIAVDTADGYYFEDEDSNEVTAPPFDVDTYSANIVAVISSVTVPITAPVKGGTPQSSVDETTGYTGTISWEGNPSTFAASTVYTAHVELTAQTGYTFAPDVGVTVAGAEVEIQPSSAAVLKFDATFPVTEDKVLTELTITGYTGGAKTHGDTIAKSELTVKAVYDDGTTDENYQDYEVVYASGSALKKDDTTVKVSSGSVESVAYTIPEVQGLTPTAEQFDFAPPTLTYDGESHMLAITSAVAPQGVTAPTYVVKKDGVQVADAIDAGDYTIYASCVEDAVYEAGSDIEVGTATIEKKTPAAGDFDLPAVSGKEYDGTAASVAAPTLKSAYTGVGAVTVKYNGSAEAPVNVGAYAVTFDVAEGTNFKAATGLSIGNLAITQAEVTVTGTGTASGAYGQKLSELTISGLTASVAGAWAFDAPDTVPYAGTADQAATFTPTDSANYKTASGTVSVTIGAVDQTPAITASADLIKGGNTLDLATLVSDAQGDVSFAIKSGDTLAALSGTTLTSGESTGSVVITVNAAAKDVNGDGVNEYNAFTGDGAITVTITDKTNAGVTIAGDAAITKTYGDADFTLTAAAANEGESGAWTWTSSDTAVATVTNDGTVTIVGQGTAAITAKYESKTTIGEATVSLRVERKTISEADFTALPTETKTYNGAAQEQTIATALVKDTDYTVEYSSNTNAGTASYTITGIGNYTGSITKEFEIAKADPTVTNVTVTSPATVYDADTIADITLGFTSEPTGGSIKLDEGQTLTVGTNEYGWTYTPADTDNYNNVTGKVSIEVMRNDLEKIEITTPPTKTAYTYGETFDKTGMAVTATFKNGATTTPTDYTVSPDGALGMSDTTITVSYTVDGVTKTAEQAISVSKAAAPAFTDESFEIKYSVAGKSFELALSAEPADAANAAYAVGTVTTTGSGTATATLSGKSLTVTISDFTAEDVGKTITVPMTFTSDNYEDAAVNAVITLKDKDVPSVTVEDITVTYSGSAVEDGKISGTATFNGSAVEGTWAFKAGQELTNVADSGVKTAVFTPTDNVEFNAVEATLTLTIEKKTPAAGDFDLPAVSGKEYDGTAASVAAPTLKSAYTGVGAVTVKYNGSAEAPVNVGAYAVTFDVAEGTNFKAATGLSIGNLAITQAEVTVTGTGTASGAYGQKLSELTISGLTASVAGAWAFDAPDTVPYAGTADQAATFTPTDSANYKTASGTVSVTIGAVDQTPAITASADLIKGGNTLDLATLVSDAQGDVSFAIKSGDTLAALSGTTLTSGESTGSVVITVNAAAKDVNGDGVNEYNAFTGDGAITVTITDKTNAGVTIAGDAAITKTYGDADFTLTAAAANEGESGAWTWTSSDTAVATVTNDGTVTIVGQGTAAITAKYESKTTIGEATVSLRVERKTISEADFTALPTETKTYNGAAQEQTIATALVKDTDYTVEYSSNTNAGTASYTITGIGNYTGSITKEFEIAKADPTVTNVTVTSPATVYDADTIADITLGFTSEPTGGSIKLDEGQTLTVGTNEYGWTYTPADTDNYNNVTGKVSIEVMRNDLEKIEITTPPTKTAYTYGETFDKTGMAVTATFKNGATTTPTDYTVSPDGALGMSDTTITVSYTVDGVTKTAEQAISVSKAAAPAFTDESFEIKYSVAGKSFELALSAEPADAANAAYAVGTVTTTGSGTATATLSGKSLTVTISDFTAEDVGKTITVPMTFTSDNYEDAAVNAVITLKDKDVPSVTVEDITVTYSGSAVEDGKISGTATFNGSAVEGTWAFKAGQELTNVADSGVKTAVFTPTDNVEFNAVEATLTLTIEKADVTGEPTFTPIDGSGKTLADAALDAGSMTPEGTIAWDDGDATEVVEGAAYGWTFTPTDSANYNVKTGTITVWEASVTPPPGPEPGPAAPEETVKIGETEHGAVTAEPTDAKEGDTVTVTVEPDEDYKLDSLTVTDAEGNEIELTDNGDGTYTFTMPAGQVNIEAKFAEKPAFVFDDVQDEETFYFEPVYWAYENGITTGTTETTFEPDATNTRAQAVTFLWRIAGCPEPELTECRFTDLDEDAFYYKAVLWAVEKGITRGTSETTFEPDAPVIRSQAITFLWRMAGEPEVDGVDSFTDVEEGSFYEEAVIWALANGITNGTSEATFSPDDACLRSQIVTFLFRTYAE